MPYSKKLLSIKTLFFLLIPFLMFSQNTTINDSVVQPPKALGNAEIVSYGQESRDLINKVKLVFKNTDKLLDIRERLVIDDSVVQQKLVLLRDTLVNFNIDQLDKIESQVGYIDIETRPWIEETKKWREETDLDENEINFHNETWRITLDSIQKLEKNIDWSEDKDGSKRLIFDRVEEQISSNLSNLDVIQQELASWNNELMKTENALALTTGGLTEILSTTSLKKQQLIENIWVPEYSPIWKISKEENSYISQETLASEIKNKFKISIRYIEDKAEFFYSLIFWFIIILASIFYLKNKSSYISENKDHLKIHERVVLKYPIIMAYVILLFGLSIIYDIPTQLTYLLLFVCILPFCVLLWELNTENRKLKVILFVLFSLLFISLSYLIEWPNILRLSLLAINGFVLFLLFKVKSKKSVVESEQRYWLGTLKMLISAFIVINSLSIIANIIGSVQLALILTRTTLGTLIAYTIIKEVVLLLQSFINMLFLGPLYKYSYILQEDGEIVIVKLNKILRVIGFLFWLFVILDLLEIRESLFASILDIINKPLKIGEISVSLGNIVSFYIIIQISIWLSSFIRYLLNKEIFPRTNMSEGASSTFSLLTKYTITFIGFLFALAGAGIELSKVALGVSALGIGIGFGLQNIINNFVSGIILAVERPFKIGDFVKVDDVEGQVIDIGLRASQIKTWNGSDVLVPNGSLISGKLTNWTFDENKIRRLDIEIHFPINTDISKAIEVIIDSASGVPKVLKKPKVFVNYEGIKDGVSVVRLYAWIKNFADGMTVGTSLKITVFEALQNKGFEITIPKLDITLKKPIEDK